MDKRNRLFAKNNPDEIKSSEKTKQIESSNNSLFNLKRFSYLIITALLILGITGCDTSDSSANIETSAVSTSHDDDSGVAASSNPTQSDDIDFAGYRLIEVAGGNLSGQREPNVVVDIGFGYREYWAFTNEYGQLIKVTAARITLQDESVEPVTDSGRYYPDEAKVPGTESPVLDEGHVIADSLGGVSNAYNITPQDSTLNRYGDQAYMEKVIRDANGCSDFTAIITYPDTQTQIPSHYSFTYTINGNVIHDEFDNIDPESVSTNDQTNPVTDSTEDHSRDLAKIDANGNGTVTIAEAKAAGFTMPIHSDFWLYDYMIDGDGDGLVGE